MSKPSFHKPLLQMHKDLKNLLNRAYELSAQIEAANSPQLNPLLMSLNDLISYLDDSQMELSQARRIEKDFRKG